MKTTRYSIHARPAGPFRFAFKTIVCAAAILHAIFLPRLVANINVPAEAGISLRPGQAFDSITFEGRESPFEIADLETVLDTSNNSVSFIKDEVEHRLDIFSSLSGGLAGSYSWGTGGVEGSFQGISLQRSTKTSYHLLVKLETIRGRRTLRQPPRLNSTAKTLLLNNPEAFLRVYGDHYIRSEKIGGRFFALIDIESTQDDTRDEIRAALSGGDVTTEFSAFLTSIKTKVENRYKLAITISYTGGYTNLPSIAALEAFYSSFPGRVEADPSVFDYEAYPLIQHPEVALSLPSSQLKYFERRRISDQLYRALRESDLALQDLEFIEAISSGAVFTRMTAADRSLLARGKDVLAKRSDWLKARLEEVVMFAQLPDLSKMPALPVLPFVLTKVQVPADESLHLQAGRTYHHQLGNTIWPEIIQPVSARIYVEQNSLYAQANVSWSWAHPSGNGPILQMGYDTGPRKIRPLPPADYYILGTCGESSCSDSFEAGPHGPNAIHEIGGRKVLNRGYRNGVFGVDYWFNPIRVVCLNVLQVAPAFVQQPISQKVARGESVVLSVDAYGTGNLSYQWRRNGSPITGETSPQLFILEVNSQSVGIYSVEVRNEVGALLSASATVGYLSAPARF